MKKATNRVQMASYGIGDFGLNIYWNAISLLLMFWYVAVVKLPPEVAGTIYFIGLVWDAVTDPIAAVMTAKTRSRFGTYRPYLMFAGPILGAVFCLLFWVPPFKGSALIIWLVAMHILFRTLYTLVSVPYSALSARVTLTSHERNRISALRMIFAFIGLLAVSVFTFPLIREIGDGTERSASGFMVTAAIGAAIATAALITCALFTKEAPPPGGTGKAPESTATQLVASLQPGSGVLTLMAVLLFKSASSASFSIALVFMIAIYAGGIGAKEAVLTATAVATLISVPLWSWLIDRTSRRFVWTVATVLVVGAGLWLYFGGLMVVAGQPVQLIIMSASFGGFAILMWAIIPDMVDMAQMKSGVRAEGVVFGGAFFVQKLAGGLMGLLVGYMLTRIGFDPDNPFQSQEAIRGVTLFFAVVPATLLTISTIGYWMLPLNHRLHDAAIESLNTTGK